MHIRSLLLLLLATFLIGGCHATVKASDAGPDAGRDQVVFLSTGEIPVVTIGVEILRDKAERLKGLKKREHLPENRGVLFIYDPARLVSFWMKETTIPLDMIFVDSVGQIVKIAEDTEPLSLKPNRPDVKIQFVVEVNAGFCRRHGIRVGDRVHLK